MSSGGRIDIESSHPPLTYVLVLARWYPDKLAVNRLRFRTWPRTNKSKFALLAQLDLSGTTYNLIDVIAAKVVWKGEVPGQWAVRGALCRAVFQYPA